MGRLSTTECTYLPTFVRVMVGEHGEGDVWGACGAAGGVDGEGVVSGHWGRNVCGPDVVVVARVL